MGPERRVPATLAHDMPTYQKLPRHEKRLVFLRRDISYLIHCATAFAAFVQPQPTGTETTRQQRTLPSIKTTK